MRYDDFMNYMADMPAGYVQYGRRIEMCDYIAANYQNTQQTMAEIFPTVINEQIGWGNTPGGYDTNPGGSLTLTTIDPNDAGRPWSYQYCTEYGWY